MVVLRAGVVCALIAAAQSRDTATCERRQLCNGAVLCDDVCVPGSIKVDSWTDSALALQRRLQKDEPLVRATLIGTHNSAITQAYGYGIEQDQVEKLTGEKMYQGDDLGEGVCNSHSVLDQLRIGLRHIEIDITAGYFQLEPNKIFVCHTPAPVDKWPLAIKNGAKKNGVDLGNWSSLRLSCEGSKVPFADMLKEIKGWVDANPEEVVILYLDVKPLTATTKAQVEALNADITTVFGDGVWTPADGSPLGVKMSEFVARGKRVIFEAAVEGVNKASPQLVFYPTLWSHQFGSGSFISFPNCSIDGDSSWYTPINAASPGKMVRGLSFGTAATVGGSDTGGKRAQQCGFNIVSGNYIQPQDLETYVWTWAAGEPAATEGCVTVNSTSARWSVKQCDQAGPLACRALNDDTTWTFVDSDGCPSGQIAASPTNGFANQHLAVAAAAAGHPLVRVNTSITA